MKRNSFTKNGYSLVEVLIAVAILMIAIVGPLTIAAKSLQSAQYARQQTTAFFLAQEGVTAINVIRSEYALRAYAGATDSWGWVTSPTIASCFAGTGCGIDFRDVTLEDNEVACTAAPTNPCMLRLRDDANRTALYSHVGGTVTPYTRIITLTRVGTSEVLVRVEVSWDTKFLGGTTQSVVLRTSLFDIYEDL